MKIKISFRAHSNYLFINSLLQC